MSDAFTVAQNVVATLAAVQDGSPPASLFARVAMSEDVSAFERISDAIPGIVAGLVCPPPRRGNKTSIGEDYCERIEMTVCLKLSVARAMNVDDTAAMTEMHRVVGLVRAALNADPTRGGLCGGARVDGRFVRPTDLRGDPKIIAGKKGHRFYTATWPVVCGRSVLV